MLNLKKYHFTGSIGIFAAFIIVLFVFSYFDAIVSLVKTWSGRDDYSHGFIVPFASLYFVYAMRDKLKTVEIKPNIALGSAVTLAGALMLVFGTTGSITNIQQLSILVVIPGLVIMLLGIEMFKALLLPLGYLVLMVPLILDVIFNPLHWPFQLFGARIASMMLTTLGIPVYHDIQYLQLPNVSLEVANACSGIRYLVSIVALAIPLAYLTQETWTKRIVLVLSSVIIGILANPVRIAIIGVWVYNGGNILHGPGHILQGYFVSVVGFVFLFGMSFILSKTQLSNMCKMRANSSLVVSRTSGNSIEKTGWKIQTKELSTDALRDCYDREQNHKKAWICAILILAVLGCFINIYKPVPVYLKNNPDQIPLELEGLKGYVADGRDDWFVRLPNPDIEIRRLYSNESAVPLYITVGYYAYQERDKKYIHYTMQNLYENAEDCRIQVDANNYITAKKVLVKDEGRRLLILYWYDIDGEVTSDNIRAKFITAVRGIIKRQTNGSIVLVARKINAEDNVETVFGHQEKFVAAIYPYLREYLHSY